MQIIVQPHLAAWAQAAAAEIAQLLQSRPGSALGLATGTTTVPLYAALAALARSASVNFSTARFFGLDEYVGLVRSHPASCYARLEAQLFGPAHISPEQIYFPDMQADDLAGECQRYEQRIRQQGGIDLQLLGIGQNGHIGFNEPGTPFESLTHVAEISADTRAVQAQTFGGLPQVPRQGLTQGLQTIRRARKVMLLAWGSHKREIIGRALLGPITPEVPASLLQLHPDLQVILDEAAAGALPLATRQGL